MSRVVWQVCLLLAVGSCILRTPTTRATASHRTQAPSFSNAVAQIEQQWRIDDSIGVPSGRSVFLTHGHSTPTAVVLLHGFGSSPRQFLSLAASLYAHGINVWVPRLPYHAERGPVTALSRLTADDIRDAAQSATDIGSGLGDSVVVLGFSMGGVAAAWIAQHRSDVTRVVLVSPALELAHVPTALDHQLVRVALLLPEFKSGLARDPKRPDRTLGWSMHAVAQILMLAAFVELDAENAPPAVNNIRVLVNEHDRTVSSDAAVALATRWSAMGADVKIYQLSDSLQLAHDFIDVPDSSRRIPSVGNVVEALARGAPLPEWQGQLRTRLTSGIK